MSRLLRVLVPLSFPKTRKGAKPVKGEIITSEECMANGYQPNGQFEKYEGLKVGDILPANKLSNYSGKSYWHKNKGWRETSPFMGDRVVEEIGTKDNIEAFKVSNTDDVWMQLHGWQLHCHPPKYEIDDEVRIVSSVNGGLGEEYISEKGTIIDIDPYDGSEEIYLVEFEDGEDIWFCECDLQLEEVEKKDKEIGVGDYIIIDPTLSPNWKDNKTSRLSKSHHGYLTKITEIESRGGGKNLYVTELSSGEGLWKDEIRRATKEEIEKDTLLEVAKRRYPVGTIINSKNIFPGAAKPGRRTPQEPWWVSKGKEIGMGTSEGSHYVLKDGKWADIVREEQIPPPKTDTFLEKKLELAKKLYPSGSKVAWWGGGGFFITKGEPYIDLEYESIKVQKDVEDGVDFTLYNKEENLWAKKYKEEDDVEKVRSAESLIS